MKSSRVLSLVLVSLTLMQAAVVSDPGVLTTWELLGDLVTQFNSLSQQVKQLSTKVTSMEAQLDPARTSVAFHALRSKDPFQVNPQGTIVYDLTITNIGDAYDRKTGIFTAPVPGTYVFFVSCMTDDGTNQEAIVFVNSRTAAVCYSAKDGIRGQGATMVTISLIVGQMVRVQVKEGAHAVRGGLWNTFSGFLLRAEA